jgi:hypothetical protein
MKIKYLYTAILCFIAFLSPVNGSCKHSASEAILELRRQYPKFKPDALEIVRVMSDAKLYRINYCIGRVTTVPKGLLDSSLTQRMAYLLDVYKFDSVVFSDGCATFIKPRIVSDSGFVVNVGFKLFIEEGGPKDGVCVDEIEMQPLDDKHLLLYEKLDRGFYIYRLLTEAGDFSINFDYNEAVVITPAPLPTQNPPGLEPPLPSSTPVHQQNGMEKKDSSK